jgi:alkanesulfonate monooxygenase SsuD/methylene tetrahydromethanopterin reductase-like flavin-dependent oxidoreductase (luciferase family)
MDIGIGLPATIPGVAGATVVEWARRAEGAGFASLGVIDRIVYANYEPLVALAAAAAVTDRVRLTTSIVLAPLRPNAALLAKQAATVDRLSDGRLVFGVAVGARRDDYAVSGVDFTRRGRIFDAQLGTLRGIWTGEIEPGVGPRPVRDGGPELILGGTGPHTARRVVAYGDGWIGGGGGAAMFSYTAELVRTAWAAAGRAGAPRLIALGYFSLGPEAREHADGYISDYYGFLGPIADQIAAGVLTDAGAVRSTLAEFESAGCDELILFPCSPGPEQVELLADATR